MSTKSRALGYFNVKSKECPEKYLPAPCAVRGIKCGECVNIQGKMTEFVDARKKEECYGYDNELGLCLMYGVDCEQARETTCFHTTRDEGMDKFLPEWRKK
jgi:hypothetical protein